MTKTNETVYSQENVARRLAEQRSIINKEREEQLPLLKQIIIKEINNGIDLSISSGSSFVYIKYIHMDVIKKMDNQTEYTLKYTPDEILDFIFTEIKSAGYEIVNLHIDPYVTDREYSYFKIGDVQNGKG